MPPSETLFITSLLRGSNWHPRHLGQFDRKSGRSRDRSALESRRSWILLLVNPIDLEQLSLRIPARTENGATGPQHALPTPGQDGPGRLEGTRPESVSALESPATRRTYRRKGRVTERENPIGYPKNLSTEFRPPARIFGRGSGVDRGRPPAPGRLLQTPSGV